MFWSPPSSAIRRFEGLLTIVKTLSLGSCAGRIMTRAPKTRADKILMICDPRRSVVALHPSSLLYAACDQPMLSLGLGLGPANRMPFRRVTATDMAMPWYKGQRE